MKFTCLTVVAAVIFAVASAVAAAPSEYQVTGVVTAITDTVLTVRKGKEVFECGRTAETKMTGGAPKIGDKVTVHYTITASLVEDKGVAAIKPPAVAAPSPAKP